MEVFLANGIYDLSTLLTLKDLGVKRFGFDLRGRSANLIPMKELKQLLATMNGQNVSLIFENDKRETILSALDLLKDSPVQFEIQLRGALSLQLDWPTQWMFNPYENWSQNLTAPWLRSILLPLKFQNFYQNHPEFWDFLSRRNIDVFLHADNLNELEMITQKSDLNLSFDLSQEIEKGFRTVDQERLKTMKIWRKNHEDIAR